MRILMSEALPYDGDVRVGSHELADRFAGDGHSVFWLGCAYHLLGLIQGALRRPAHRAVWDGWRRGPQELRPRLWAYHPVSVLPYRDRAGFRSSFVLHNSLRFTMPPLARILDQHRFRDPDLLWLSQGPNSAAIAGRVRAARTAFRISDRYEDFSGTPPSAVQAERRLLEKADVIFATARPLLDALPAAVRAKAHLLPNGVDLGHFRPPERPTTEPEDLRPIPRPRAVFTGTLAEWVDLDLVAAVATRMAGVSFLLIGPVRTKRPIRSLPGNVHLLGPRSYADLPRYLHHADAGIIPFVKSRRTDAVSSNKLYQYFAAGLPVVATRLKEMERLRPPVLFADSAEPFADCLKDALAGGTREEFLSFAEANTWESRYEIVKQALAS